LRSTMGRARTEEHGGAPQPGPGIQVFHYKDPEVEEIVRNTNKEEIRRRMSHGELLRGFTGEQQAGVEQQASVENSDSDSKVFFNAQVGGWFLVHTDGSSPCCLQVMLRSQSGSSTTSR
jgi:hypothetical protein